MVQRKSKILDTDLQLYLTGELEGEKLARVSEIDATQMSELKLLSERRAKEVLGKLREVDQMFESAAEESFPMPVAFEKQVEQILASKAKLQKKNTTSLLDKIKAYFTGANIWSLAGGGAAASFVMLSVIQISPGLLIDLNSVRSADPVFRGGQQSQLAPEVACAFDPAGSWTVTDEFLLQVQVCSKSDGNKLLTDGGKANDGDGFSIFVLPTQSIDLAISYKDRKGMTTPIAEGLHLDQGKLFSMVDIGNFKTSIGAESFVFKTGTGETVSLTLTID